MAARHRSSLKKALVVLLLITAVLFFPGETKAVSLEEKDYEPKDYRIIFTAGEERFEYSLQELALEMLEGDGDKYTICKNPSWLAYQLFQLSRIVKKPPGEAIVYIDNELRIKYTPGLNGRELDLARLIVQLGNPAPYQGTYPLPLKSLEGTINENILLNSAPEVLWSQFTTQLTNIADRTENVRLASEQLNGLLIAPGQTVSFNEIVGPREKERGFREAQIIVDGGFEPGLGGGVCQVSSTLYNTVLLAGLEIKERYNHSVRIAYVPLGCDATVVFGTKDFKFRNNTDSYLLLKTRLTGLSLTMEVFGSKEFPYSEVKVYTKLLRTIPPPEQVIFDESLDYPEKRVLEKGAPGYVSETYRVFITEEGTWEEKLSGDYYSPQKEILAVSIIKDNKPE